MDISNLKHRFASQVARVSDPPSAARNAIVASLQRNHTYSSPTAEGSDFRIAFSTALQSVGDSYVKDVSDEMHAEAIQAISVGLSAAFAGILLGEHLRIGTVQKALNLYVKTLWCLDARRASPPHCPIDGTILAKGGIQGKWTDLDSLEVYMEWIQRLRLHAFSCGFEDLAEWELVVW